MIATPDDIALLVQKQYDALPAKRKPAVRDNGLHEWVPLSGIVAERNDGTLYCLALATGMKCLPASKLPQAQGQVLHDWHAEVLAIRAFNRFVLEECRRLALDWDAESRFLRRRALHELRSAAQDGDGHGDGEGRQSCWAAQPFAWRDDVALHMYCSEAPCGDASMELTMAAQEDAAPWEIPSLTPPPSTSTSTTLPSSPSPSHSGPPDTPTLPGRAYFSLLGAVRRKPSRADAPETRSKSCSDKLALRQCVSLLSSITAVFVAPSPGIYIRHLVLPASRYSARGCRRAFGGGNGQGEKEEEGDTDADDTRGRGEGRMAPLVGRTWQGGYVFRPFKVQTTCHEFTFSRREVALRAAAATSTVISSPMPLSSSPLSTTDPRPHSHTHPNNGNENAGVHTKTTASNLAVAWTAGPSVIVLGSESQPRPASGSGLEESTLGGLVRGRRQVDAQGRGASLLCRRRIWGLAAEVAGLLQRDEVGDSGAGASAGAGVGEIWWALAGSDEGMGTHTYGTVKNSALLAARRRVKEDVRAKALRGWVSNEGDDGFEL